MNNNNIIYYNYFKVNNINYFIGVTNLGLAYFLKDNEVDFLKDKELIKNIEKTNSYELEIIKYFNKELKEFTLQLDLQGTDFQKSVWKILLTIPYGQTLSYSQVAEKLGDIKKVRAVANAIGKNNILIVVPCHRVIGKNKKLTGFSSGLDLKEYLLKLEDFQNYLV